jgi:hypothetical protein
MTDHSAPFSDMAARIEHNKPQDFAGAVVIVPPNGDAMIMLSLDPSQDAATFWSMVRTKIEVVWKGLVADERRKDTGWGQR